ncbi:FAD-binding oxidoreductase [Rhodococcus sp. KBW08]|uniref:NAD(P)/FAD-dependent oxidoreductase n=1 Tax=Rhodococcus sp. KBW08 TaxID=2144188 RepID=UPI0016257CDC|nr:FAD-dependent oxidoreductase [Rhodococcus sp. KBW08]
MSTVVIGGGVIGLNIAWSLRRRGEEVCVLEHSAIGRSVSAVNAGWITPSLSTPLASPGVFTLGLKHAFDRDGALSIRPKLDTEWIKWLWKFRRAARPDVYETGVRALFHLNAQTLDLFDELHDDGVDFEMHQAGLLALAQTPGGLGWFTQLFDQLLPMGFTGKIDYLTGSEARELDPAVGTSVSSAVLTSLDRHVNPESLLCGLHKRIDEMGVLVRENTSAQKLTRNGSSWSVETAEGNLSADNVVVALGAATNTVLRPLGITLPIVGAKGYSIDLGGAGALPQHSLYLMEPKLGLSPYLDTVRIAGAFELPANDESITNRRIRNLVDQARPYLSGWTPDADLDISTGRAGLRPSTPDSLPFIGPLPGHNSLFVAAGHGMLGVTLAPATAEGIAELVTSNSLPSHLLPFQLAGRI